MSRRTSTSVATAAIAGRMNEAIEVRADARTAPGAEASARPNPPDSIPRSNRYRWTFRSRRVPVRARIDHSRAMMQMTSGLSGITATVITIRANRTQPPRRIRR